MIGETVEWHIDNWAANKTMVIGSTKRNCMEVAVRIAELDTLDTSILP